MKTNIGKEIRKKRLQMDMKAVQVAMNAGVSPSALSAIENGYGSSKRAVQAVCKVLKIDESEFATKGEK